MWECSFKCNTSVCICTFLIPGICVLLFVQVKPRFLYSLRVLLLSSHCHIFGCNVLLELSWCLLGYQSHKWQTLVLCSSGVYFHQSQLTALCLNHELCETRTLNKLVITHLGNKGIHRFAMPMVGLCWEITWISDWELE